LLTAKAQLRDEVWGALRSGKVARFPGADGRIPNFVGAEAAAERLRAVPAWQDAGTVKANPDAPQWPVRQRALEDGRTLYMAVPRLAEEKPFFLLDPTRLADSPRQASSIKGASRSAVTVDVSDLEPVDLVVAGCVAVGEDGARLGKGGGFSDLELAVAAEAGLIDPSTVVVTTVHDVQVRSAGEIPTAGHDIHAATAARVFKVPLDHVGPDQRRLAKVANFGSIYGQGEYGLSQQLGITGDVAREFLGQYWSTYARLREYLDDVRRKAREEGLVVSATGRRRAIPDLRSPNFQLRGAAERMAINFPMQSLAADIIKIAMVRLHREIEADEIEGRMLLQVHDELLFEVPRSEVDQFAEKVPRIMTGAYELETGIEVEMKVGPNWADMKKLAVVRA